MRRASSCERAFTELKDHGLPRDSAAFAELRVSVANTINSMVTYSAIVNDAVARRDERVFTAPQREKRAIDDELSRLALLREALARWVAGG